jgi:hypothetical protein
MGCDIHSVAQVKKDNKWVTVKQRICGDPRSYNTFGILADVRNGFGTAGCDTGDGFRPIHEQRGLPEDFALIDDDDHPIKNVPSEKYWSHQTEAQRAEYAKEALESTEVWMGDHSHSWALLSELEAYAEKYGNAGTKIRGYINEVQYEELKKTGKFSESWAGGIWGPNIITMSMSQYDAAKATDELPTKEIYIKAEWEKTYFEVTYLKEIIESLRKIKAEYKTDDVRYVYGFDS